MDVTKGKWKVTAFSRLAGRRVDVSKAVMFEAAQKLLTRMKENAASSKLPRSYIRPRIERQQPIQLTINFEENERKT